MKIKHIIIFIYQELFFWIRAVRVQFSLKGYGRYHLNQQVPVLNGKTLICIASILF